jgi:hypothetical protein
MRKIVFGTTALLLALAALGGVSHQRAVAQKGKGGPSLNANIDLNKTVDDISKTIGAANNRGAWVRGLQEQLTAKYGTQYNVMVYNMQRDYEFNPPPGTYKFYRKTFDGGILGKIDYGIWVFRSAAVFKNKGDGGYINWAFSGVFTRNGGTVTFSAR